MLLAELDQISSPLHFEVPPAEGNSKTISNFKKLKTKQLYHINPNHKQKER